MLVAGGQAVGIGAGQQSRVDAGEIAARKAAGRAKGGASATDGFYPFPDGIDAAVAAGVDGVFMEVHDNPAEAKSDGANALPLSGLENILQELLAIRNALKLK